MAFLAILAVVGGILASTKAGRRWGLSGLFSGRGRLGMRVISDYARGFKANHGHVRGNLSQRENISRHADRGGLVRVR